MKKRTYLILVVDDDEVDRETILRLLAQSKKYNFHILKASNVEDGFRLFLSHSIDCILLDYILHGATGFDFINKLSHRFAENLPPIVILTNQGSENVAVSFLQSGALDYVRKENLNLLLLETVIINSINKRELQHQHKHDELESDYLASHDELTTLANRRELNRSLGRYISASKRYHRLMALLFCDLDKFKVINDTFGHVAGDLVLKQVADRLQQRLRKSDFSARVGGDEFVLILDEVRSEKDVARVASSLCDAINQPFLIMGQVINITISIGIVSIPSDTDDILELLNRADKAMYHAKISGENRYHFYA